MDSYIPLTVFSFLAAFLTTPLIGRVARRTGFIDEPKPHKMHVQPIPLLGGLAIYIALGAALIQVDLSSDLLEVAAVGAGSTLLMLVGLWDDRRGMSPRIKILAQIITGVTAATAGIRVELFPWPALNYGITIFWFVGIINAINLMDNMDGLAAGTSTVSALFFTLLAATAGQGLVASLAAAVTGASLGFLYYNISPAMVFMGDAGALLLGFLLAVIGIKYTPAQLPLGSTWMVPIVVLGLPIFDTTLVTYARLFSRRPVSQGGTDHTSHRLARLGLGINRAVMTMYLAAGLLGMAAVFMSRSTPETATVIFLGILVLGVTGVLLLERARPMPPANPPVVILGEDSQACTAIRAAKKISSDISVVTSPSCTAEQMEQYLRELALAGDVFQAWLDAGGKTRAGPVENWHAIFRIAGKVVPCPRSPDEQAMDHVLRNARAVILCRGDGWPDSLRRALGRLGGRLLSAPEALAVNGISIAADGWEDPAALVQILEDALIGYRRKEKRT